MIKIYTTRLTASNRLKRHNESINLLEFAIAQTWNKVARLRLGWGEYGKPHLLDCPNIHFNFTYAGDRVFCVVADKCVGIDAEEVGEAPLEITPLYFAEDENEYLYERDTNRRFFEIWTKKESYMKYKGLGFFMSPLTFSALNLKDTFLYDTVWENTALAVASERQIKTIQIIAKG